jgi:hypothetical protein
VWLLVLVAVARLQGADSINAVAGDASVVFGYAKPNASESQRVRGHLRFARDVIAAADVSSWPIDQRFARARNLARLDRYIEEGLFPRNTVVPRRRPVFVDERGAICAVGALFAADRGAEAAERVARSYRFAYVHEIDDRELAGWQAASGLMPHELALIQPSYMTPRYTPWMDRVWIPSALLDRQLVEGPRAVFTTEIDATAPGAGGLGTVHVQGTPGFFSTSGSAYATLPVGMAGDGPDWRLGNAELGLYDGSSLRRAAWVGRVGIMFPTNTDQMAQSITARAGDAALWQPRAWGLRVSGSGLLSRFRHFNDKELIRGRITTRLDLGGDVLKHHDRDAPVLIPRAGVGVAFTYRPYSVLLESALAYAPGSDREHYAHWSSAVSFRCADEQWDRCTRYQPAIMLAAVRTLPEGWTLLLTLEIAVVGEPPAFRDNNTADEWDDG